LTEVRDTNEKHGIKDDYANYYLLGEVRRLRHDAGEASILDRQAQALNRQSAGENSEPSAQAHYYLGLALRDSGDAANAEAELCAALASFASFIPGAEHPAAATIRLELGKLLAVRADTHEEGVQLLAAAAAIREQFLGADDPLTQQARQLLLKAQQQH